MLRQLQKAVSGLLGPLEAPEEEEAAAGNSIEYAYEDLAAATGGFSPGNRLGAGAAGSVFRGYLRGTEVAVKELAASPGQLNGFDDELRVLSRFRHPNLVTLLGWGQQSAGAGVKYLVYELLQGGDVEKRLRRCKDGRQAFPWQHRLSVAIDAACGLSYMVNSQPKAFHRDIKPPNILLDANGTAKMADFGLAGTVKKRGKGHLTVSDISGTPGYADPHYIQTGKVTEASEVYSFGTVLLELLMNERPALCGPNGDIIYPLVQIVQPAAPGALERVVARQDLQAAWPRPLLEHFSQLALGCISGRPERRPPFEALVETLRHFQASAGGLQGPPPQQAEAQARPQPPGPQRGLQQGGCPAPQRPQSPQRPQAQAQAQALHAAGGRDRARSPAPEVSRRPEAGGDAHGRAARAGSSTPPPCHRRPPQAGGYGSPQHAAAAAAAAKPSPGARPQRPLAEILLECVHADGVDLSQLADCQRTASFPLDPTAGRVVVLVGRQHQPDLFEAVVPKRERLACISRTHFEIVWEPAASSMPMLRKLSGNSLVLDNRELSPEETVPVWDGACLRFSGIGGGDLHFLSLRVMLRPHSDVSADVHAPAGPAAPGHGTPKPLQRHAAAAVLECVHAEGGKPSSLAPELRTIALCLEETLEIGRQHQRELFDELLRAEPQWLAFISRSHCRATLLRAGPPAPGAQLLLQVENLSANVVLISGRQLAKGGTDLIAEGGTLSFVARPPGSAEETHFLRLELRRA